MSTDKLQSIGPADVGPVPAGLNGLVPAGTDAPQAVMPYNPFDGVQRYWANFKLADRAMKRLVLRAFSEATIPANDLIGKRFTMSRVLIHPVQFVDPETGEVIDAHRTVIQTGEDKLIAFVSAGIIKSIGLICMMEGQGPWDPPLVVELRQTALKNARRMFSLDLIDDELPEAPKGGSRRAK